MGIFRDKHGSIERSSSHEIYGIKNGLLIVSLDICIMQINPSNVVRFDPPGASSDLIGAPVKLTSGAKVGTIKKFDWPPTTLQTSDVNPVVSVELASNVNISSGTPPSVADPTEVSVNEPVSLKIEGVEITGKVITTIQPYPYPIRDFEVQAFRVDFDQILLDRAHGARVELNTGKLLGMLIATQNVNGKCQAFVYPAAHI